MKCNTNNTSKGQKWYISHAEQITQTVLGTIVGFVILKLWGMSTQSSILLQMVFIVTSYIRGYLVRRLFNRLF